MRQTLRLGRPFGIAVGVHWSVLVILILVAQGLAFVVLPESAPGASRVTYWLIAAGASIVLLVLLLAHEISHALVARRYGVRTRQITLWLLGGVAELDREAPTPRADLWIAIAGPLASLGAAIAAAAFAVVLAVVGLGMLAVVPFAWLAWVNALLALFNLLPGAPLDGGRVLRAIVWRVRGQRATADRVATLAGMVMGLLLATAGAIEIALTGTLNGAWLILLGWFLIFAAQAERGTAGLTSLLRGVTARDVLTPDPAVGRADQTVDDFVATVVQRSPHAAFPVVDASGYPVGTVSSTALDRVRGPRRPLTPLRDVMDPAAAEDLAAPQTHLTDGVLTAVTRPGHLVCVIDDGRLLGVISASDIQRAIRLARLGIAPPSAGA